MKLRYNLEQRRWIRYVLACWRRGDRAYPEFYRHIPPGPRRRGPFRLPQKLVGRR